MAYVNHANFCGRVANTPIFESDRGERLKFLLALNKPGAARASYLDCVVWGVPATQLQHTLSKGDEIFLTGEIESSSYLDERGSWHRAVILRVEQYSIQREAKTVIGRQLKPPV